MEEEIQRDGPLSDEEPGAEGLSLQGVSCPAQVVTLQSQAEQLLQNDPSCPEKLLSHESRWRPQEEEAAWSPLTDSDQSANTTTASRPVCLHWDHPTLAWQRSRTQLDFSSLNSITCLFYGAQLSLEKSNSNTAAWLMTFNSFLV